MKNNTWIIFSIILLLIIAIALIIFMILAINGNIEFSKIKSIGKINNELVVDENYDIEFNGVYINTSASNIYVKKSNNSDFRLIIYGNKEQTIVNTDNNTLVIEIEEKSKFLNFNIQVSKVEIYLPESFNKKIDINNNYGDIQIDEFLNSEIKINEDCGDVSVLGGNKVDIANNLGNIVLNKANQANIKQSAGDVVIGTVNDINIENNYGDVKIDKVTEHLKIEEDCGDVDIDSITLNQNSDISNNCGDIKINSTNEIYFDAKTSLGDVKINNNYQKSDIILKLKNDCGDIEVNN